MIAPAERRVTVLVVDDHRLVRQRLCELISSETCALVVGDVGSAREAIESFEQLRPEAVVLDLGLPDGSGIDVLRRMKQLIPFCFVIVLTQFDEPVFAGLARAAGADCFFHKSSEFERVGEILRELAQGKNHS